MRARDVIGKKIVAVEHDRWYDSLQKKSRRDCTRLVLEDGSIIVCLAYETIDCPAATMELVKAE